jgi:hypothetical protein
MRVYAQPLLSYATHRAARPLLLGVLLLLPKRVRVPLLLVLLVRQRRDVRQRREACRGGVTRVGCR